MYRAPITRLNKAAFVILIDRSGSMAEEVTFEGRLCTKAEATVEAVNTLLEEIINRSYRDRFIGDYFDVAIIGYGGEGVESLLGSGFKPITFVDSMYIPSRTKIVRHTLPSGRRCDTVVETRQWLEPQASGQTPMGKAFAKAYRMVASWCRKHPNSFPPIVINITDGEATDVRAEKIRALAEQIKSTSTNDGGTLLMNIHLASQHDSEFRPLRFPAEGSQLPINRHSRLLYDISSTLPPIYNSSIEPSHNEEPPFRAICYNAPIDDILGLLVIGSLSINQLF